MLSITRPDKDLSSVAGHIETAGNEWAEQCSALARDVLKSYTPRKGKGLLFAAVGTREAIAGGYGVGPSTLLPDKHPAPRGVIAEFLAMHPE